jgi:hypothetical protein
MATGEDAQAILAILKNKSYPQSNNTDMSAIREANDYSF